LPQLGRFPCAGHQNAPPRTGRGLAEDCAPFHKTAEHEPPRNDAHSQSRLIRKPRAALPQALLQCPALPAGGHRRHQRPFDASRHVTMTVKPAGHAVAGTQTARALWTENQTSSALALNTKQLSQSRAVRKVTTVGAASQQRTSKPSNRCVCLRRLRQSLAWH